MASFTKFDPRAFLESEKTESRRCDAATSATLLANVPSTVATVAVSQCHRPQFQSPPHPAYDADALRDRYKERAAIIEFDGQEDRARAEARAWNEVSAIWYRRHGEHTPGHLCAGCGKPVGASSVITLPCGERVHAPPGERAFDCLHAYGYRWKAAAAKALVKVGIPAPAPGEETP